jgi:hypothetical protein
LPFYHKNLAFINHHLGPWFEGFTFIKDCMRKSGTKTPKLPETSKQHQMALLARLGEYTYSSWRVVACHGELGGEQTSRNAILLT